MEEIGLNKKPRNSEQNRGYDGKEIKLLEKDRRKIRD